MMKRTVKRLTSAFILFSLLLSLTGCKYIQDLREKQIFISKDGTATVEGRKYIPLDEDDLENGYLYPTFNYSYDYFLADETKPLLINSLSDNAFDMSIDKVFLEDTYGDTMYCLAEEYECVTDLLRKEFVPTGYYISYYTNDAFSFETYDYDFSKDEITALQALLSSEPIDNMSNKEYAELEYLTQVTAYSEKKYYNDSGSLWILKDETQYYLENYLGEQENLHLIPDELLSDELIEVLETFAY